MYDRRVSKAAIHAYLIIDSITGRWYWNGPKNNRGYGRVRLSGFKQPQLVNRIIHWLYVGPVPPDWEVDHKNGNCNDVTPSNLEAVPKDENIRRAAERGAYRGERNGNSKLDEEKVSLIKLFYHEFKYTQKRISEELEVHPRTVSDICRGKTWKHVTEDWTSKPGENREKNPIETV